MSVETCIEEYLAMAPEIFPEQGAISTSRFGKLATLIKGTQKFSATPFEKIIKRLVKKYLGQRATAAEDTVLRFEACDREATPRCKV